MGEQKSTERATEGGAAVKTGDVFEVAYPFVHGVVRLGEGDGEEYVSREVPTWKPGVRFEMVMPDDSEAIADGIGKQILTVVDVFKPGRFPARVFYTRQWESPDGKRFGKGALIIKTQEAFRRRTRGYWHQYTLRAAPLPPDAILAHRTTNQHKE